MHRAWNKHPKIALLWMGFNFSLHVNRWHAFSQLLCRVREAQLSILQLKSHCSAFLQLGHFPKYLPLLLAKPFQWPFLCQCGAQLTNQLFYFYFQYYTSFQSAQRTMPCTLSPALANIPRNSLTGQESRISREVEKATGVQAVVALSPLGLSVKGWEMDIPQTGVISQVKKGMSHRRAHGNSWFMEGERGHCCPALPREFIQSSPESAHTWQSLSVASQPHDSLCMSSMTDAKFLSRISNSQDFLDHLTKSQVQILHLSASGAAQFLSSF